MCMLGEEADERNKCMPIEVCTATKPAATPLRQARFAIMLLAFENAKVIGLGTLIVSGPLLSDTG